MNQPTLLDKPVAQVAKEIAVSAAQGMAQETALAISPPPQPGPALMEFRKGFMEMTIPRMLQALGEYTDWRKAFRGWLLSIMVEGIHYGWAPGCAPKWCDKSGNDTSEEEATHCKTWSAKKNANTITPLSEYLPKRNMLAAGADLVCDALWVRDIYAADMETWQMFGSKPGCIVRKCKLFSKITDEFLGEGTGGRTEGQKGGDVNNTIKMADKSSKVAAVLNTYGLRDLFTQDMEPGAGAINENPEQKTDAPQAPPRSDRVTIDDITALLNRWKKAIGPDAKPEEWSAFVAKASNRLFEVKKPFAWTPVDIERVDAALKERHDA